MTIEFLNLNTSVGHLILQSTLIVGLSRYNLIKQYLPQTIVP